ncbi:MAG: hypothetical protein JHC93_05005 [Parachlamydiales bacterium]|nr:hypothetical protein [Parachlamydiales bacterium]
MTTFYLYAGDGVHRPALALIADFIETNFPKYSVQLVGPKFFSSFPNWEKNAAGIIIPGGRDLPYMRDLKGVANQRISDFVHDGGRYLGICAGAYYAASYVDFERGGELEVLGERELGFFQGTAIGPAYGLGQYSYETDDGAVKAQVLWKEPDSHISSTFIADVYFNGGCAFEKAELKQNTSVLGYYSDILGQPAAIVKCRVGKGIAILSGVHPEMGDATNYIECKRLFKRLILQLLSE